MEAIRITQGRPYVYDSACLHSVRVAGLSTLGHESHRPNYTHSAARYSPALPRLHGRPLGQGTGRSPSVASSVNG